MRSSSSSSSSSLRMVGFSGFLTQRQRRRVLLVVLLLAASVAVSSSLTSPPSSSASASSSSNNNNSNNKPPSPSQKVTKVLVTGASGRTGALVLERLLNFPLQFEPRALVRSEASGKKLRKLVKRVDLNQIVVCDVTSLQKTMAQQQVPHELEGAESLIICTSAVPAVSKLSLLYNFLKIPFNLIRGKKAMDFRSLRFVWKYKGYPELVDYEGQIAQIDLAKSLGIKQVVIVSSMGGTDPSNFLNAVGKNPDGTGNGDILLWKRKAERYLVNSGLDSYAIIHPGGLVDTQAGQYPLILDVDDKLMSRNPRSISRGDVANLCIAALTAGKGQKVALDCIAPPPPPKTGENAETVAVVVKSAEEALGDFLKEGKPYNFEL